MMTRLSAWKKASTVFVMGAAMVMVARAQTFTILASLQGNDGERPLASLIQAPDGNFYTTSSQGNLCGYCGTIVRVTPVGTMTLVHAFDGNDGMFPQAGLTLTVNGDGYGTTFEGGMSTDGTVFKILQSGKFTTLYNFGSGGGVGPLTALTATSDGHLYGTTGYGGKYQAGTVFKITPNGILTTIHTFDGKDGAFPTGALIQATDGMLYGTTYGEGGDSCRCGTVFRISPAGVVTTLHRFLGPPNDGAHPQAGLIEGSDGDLYGTTWQGGASDEGTVFRIASNGAFTLLHSFSYNDGEYPTAGLVQATDGNFYGTASEQGPGQRGTLFSINASGAFAVVHSFSYPPDASEPGAAVIQGTDGTLYGTTIQGGSSGAGTVYSLNLGLGPFVSLVINSAKVGQTVGILGQGFIGTTSVSLNGIPASFTVVSDTFINATVPPGATTGFVTVVTPSGTLTSNVPFRVLP